MRKRFLAASMAALMAVSVLGGCSGGSDKGTAATTKAETGGTKAADAAGDTKGAEDAKAAGDTKEAASGGEKVTLSLCWWGNQTRNDVTKKAVDLYMSLNPNVEIKVEFSDWTGYWDKLAAMAAGGNLPDIIQQDYAYINQYQKSGQLADLTEFMDSGLIDVSKIPESIIESGSIDGKCYALSLGSNAPMFIYDKAIVDQAGVTMPEQPTMDELYDIAQTIYEKTGVYTLFDGGLTTLQTTARCGGRLIFDELLAGDSTTVKEHFANVERFAKAESAISPDILAEKNPEVVETKPIADATTWNDIAFSNMFISITNTAGRELGACMFPKEANSVSQPMYLKPSMFFSIAETSKNKEEAAKFIDWFTNSVECNEVLMAERGVPINTEVAAAIKEKVDDTTKVVFDFVTKAGEVATPIDPPDPAGKGEVDAQIKLVVEDIRYGDVTAEEAAEKFTADAQRILQEAAK